MSNEELVKLYKEGNKEVLKTLIEQNKGLVMSIVNKFYTSNINSTDKEDLEQEGIIGLINAIENYDFDNEKKASFSSYAVYKIYGKISRFVNNNITNETSLNTPIGSEEDNLELIDTIDSGIDAYNNVEERIYLQELRNELEQAMKDNNSLYEINLLKLRYGWDNNKICTYKELADIFNSNAQKTSRDEYKALKKLRTSTWGKEQEKLYFTNKAIEIKENSRFNQDRAVDLMNIVDKYLGGVC